MADDEVFRKEGEREKPIPFEEMNEEQRDDYCNTLFKNYINHLGDRTEFNGKSYHVLTSDALEQHLEKHGPFTFMGLYKIERGTELGRPRIKVS